MAFLFPLDSVLHLRKRVEKQQELRLLAANQQVDRIVREIAGLDSEINSLHISQQRALSAGTTAAELRFILQCEGALLRREIELQGDLTKAERLRDEVQGDYREARRKRESLDSLRKNALRAYEKQSARREQRQLDDLFLLRRAYVNTR